MTTRKRQRQAPVTHRHGAAGCTSTVETPVDPWHKFLRRGGNATLVAGAAPWCWRGLPSLARGAVVLHQVRRPPTALG